MIVVKYQTLRKNISILLIIIHLQREYLMQKQKEKHQLKYLTFRIFLISQKNPDLNKKIATLATKAESKAEQDKIVKLESFNLNYFRGKNHFEDDATQNQ